VLAAASFPGVREALWGLAASGVLYVVGHVLWLELVRLWWAAPRERLGVEPAPAGGLRRRLLVVGIYVFGFMISAGTLGAACCFGAVIAEGFA
jgi:hypothetical protein